MSWCSILSYYLKRDLTAFTAERAVLLTLLPTATLLLRRLCACADIDAENKLLPLPKDARIFAFLAAEAAFRAERRSLSPSRTRAKRPSGFTKFKNLFLARRVAPFIASHAFPKRFCMPRGLLCVRLRLLTPDLALWEKSACILLRVYTLRLRL